MVTWLILFDHLSENLDKVAHGFFCLPASNETPGCNTQGGHEDLQTGWSGLPTDYNELKAQMEFSEFWDDC